MLIENEKLYKALENTLRTIYSDNEYVFVHAIYEPDDDGDKYEGLYHAGVDLHKRGETYHVYFAINDDDSITIDTVERWYFG